MFAWGAHFWSRKFTFYAILALINSDKPWQCLFCKQPNFCRIFLCWIWQKIPFKMRVNCWIFNCKINITFCTFKIHNLLALKCFIPKKNIIIAMSTKNIIPWNLFFMVIIIFYAAPLMVYSYTLGFGHCESSVFIWHLLPFKTQIWTLQINSPSSFADFKIDFFVKNATKLNREFCGCKWGVDHRRTARREAKQFSFTI